MLQGIRHALRLLLKSPTFTIVAIATLSLGIGANTAVLNLVNVLLIKPLPYRAPQRLVLLFEQFKAQGLERIPVSPPEYLAYQKQTNCFERLAAFDYGEFNLTGGDLPQRVAGAVVTPSAFPLLGIEPVRGRVFAESEGELGRDNVVIISTRLWQTRFNSDPQLVGRQLSINGRSFTVVGIMPEKFEFPLPLFNLGAGQFGDQVDLWKPLAFTPDEMKNRGSRSYGVIGRLRDGFSVAQTQAQLDGVTRHLTQQFRDNYPENSFGATIYSLHEQVIGGMRSALWILLGAVVLVLLIACANLTTMLLARAGTREREMAIRVALGAGRFRLLRQLLTESVLLALVGGIAGVFLAVFGLDLLRAIGAQTVPRLHEVALDRTVLLFTLAVSVATGILFGLLPALATARPQLTEALKEGGRGSSEGRRRNHVRNVLVVAEMALAFVLLIGAGLLLKSFVRLQNVDPGFNPHNVLTMSFWLPNTKYSRGQPVINFYSEIQRRVRTLSGVETTALVDILPLSGTKSDSSFNIEGGRTDVMPDEQLRTITPDYFRLLQTRLLRGRFFNEADTTDAPKVVIVNQALAKRYWPNEDAVGKRITFDDPKKDPKWVTVVGLVGDIRDSSLDEAAPPEYYLPHAQAPYRSMTLVARSAQDPAALASAVRREVLAFDPDQPIAKIRTLDEVVSDSVAPRRLAVLLVGIFAGIALILAAVGIYGVMAFLVAQRTHEIGVRMALGAQAKNILRLVLGHALKLVVLGVVAGVIAAVLSTRVLQSLLYNVGVFDIATFIIVFLVLAPAALLASYIPARRATRADPMIALGRG